MKRNKSSKKKKQVKKPEAIKTLQEDIQEEIDKIDNLPNEIDRLLEQYLPDKELLQTAKDALKSKNSWGTPDWSSRLKAVDFGWRAKGRKLGEKDLLDGVKEITVRILKSES